MKEASEDAMDDATIERIWRKADLGEALGREELTRLLAPRVQTGSRAVHRLVWFYLAVQLVTLVLIGINLAGYRANAVMLAVELGAGAVTAACAVYAVRTLGELRALDSLDVPLGEAVRRRLAFYRGSFRRWPWSAALSLLTLTFAVNSLIDNQGGTYTIHHPVEFALVQLVMVAIVVFSLHQVFAPQVRELCATLDDLEAQLLDRTRAFGDEQVLWKARRQRLLLAIVLLVFLTLGLWAASS